MPQNPEKTDTVVDASEIPTNHLGMYKTTF